MIHFLDDVANQFQCNVNLGESFWNALSSTVFCCQTNKFPLLRISLALANLASDKIEDGVSKMLNKSDVAMLAGWKGIHPEGRQV